MKELQVRYAPEKLRVEGHTLISRYTNRSSAIEAVRKVVEDGSMTSHERDHAYNPWNSRTEILYEVSDLKHDLVVEMLQSEDKILISQMKNGEYEKAKQRVAVKHKREKKEEKKKEKRKRYREQAEKYNAIVNLTMDGSDCKIYYRGYLIDELTYFWVVGDRTILPDEYRGNESITVRYRLIKRIGEILTNHWDYRDIVTEIFKDNMDSIAEGNFKVGDFNAYLSVMDPDNK